MGNCTGCYKVHTSSVGIVEKWGRFSKIAQPGFLCTNCCSESVETLDLRVNQMTHVIETKTKDNVFVNAKITVQYQVSEGSEYDAFYSLKDPPQQISAYVFSEIRAIIPQMNLDDVFLAKQKIADEVKNQLGKEMVQFGYRVIQVLIIDVEPPADVKNAMNSILVAQRQRIAAVDKAEADKISRVKIAEAERELNLMRNETENKMNLLKAESNKMAAIRLAEGQAEAKRLNGIGVAQERQAICAGYKETIDQFGKELGMQAEQVTNIMLFSQYYDTLEKIGSKSGTTLFLPSSPEEVSSQVMKGNLFSRAPVVPSPPVPQHMH